MGLYMNCCAVDYCKRLGALKWFHNVGNGPDGLRCVSTDRRGAAGWVELTSWTRNRHGLRNWCMDPSLNSLELED